MGQKNQNSILEYLLQNKEWSCEMQQEKKYQNVSTCPSFSGAQQHLLELLIHKAGFVTPWKRLETVRWFYIYTTQQYSMPY